MAKTPIVRRPMVYALLLVGCSLSSALWPQTRGWVDIDLPETGGRGLRLIAPEVDVSQKLPLIVFLHGAGGEPRHYKPAIVIPARTLAVPVVLPKSSSPLGWGFGNDAERVTEAIIAMQEILDIDPERISIAGHSAGGGFAILLGLGQDSIFNAIFQLSSPFVSVHSTPPNYTPALRQYYGEDDRNFTEALPGLRQQWINLGLPFEEQIEPGFGHSTWPATTYTSGFQFLLDKVRPEETLPGFQQQPPPEPPPAPCANGTTLCLLNERFEVTVQFTIDGNQQDAQVVPGSSADSGLLWFFQASNWEVLVKLIDGCALNNHFWVFSAATTDVAYILNVRDRITDDITTYQNLAGEPAPAITDTTAFATCDG